MNTVKQAIHAWLSSQPALSVLVGGTGVSPATEDRIYPVKLPEQPELPALTYSIVSHHSEYTEDGAVGLGQSRIQVSTWAKDLDDADAIVEVLQELLVGYLGLWSDVKVAVVQFNRGPDLYEDDDKIYQIPCHLLVWHGENT